MNDSIQIWARGGLGNQVLEYLFGIASALNSNLEYTLHFSSKEPDAIDNIFHKQGEVKFLELFSSKRNINISPVIVKKVCYWDETYASIFFKYREIIFKNHLKMKFNVSTKSTKKYSAIHVRGTDKCLDEAFNMYDRLFYCAKANGLPIVIVTDDNKLSIELANRHSIPIANIQSKSITDDWLVLLKADHIYSIYSTFSYCILLIDPFKQYTLSSYEDSMNSYKHVGNEFRILCELQKYCPNFKILEAKKLASTAQTNELTNQGKLFFNSVSQCKFLSNADKIYIANLLEVADLKNINDSIHSTLNLINTPALPAWHKTERHIQEHNAYLKDLIFGEKNTLLNAQIPLYQIEKGIIQCRDILAYQAYQLQRDQTRSSLLKDDLIENVFDKLSQDLDEYGIVLIPNFLNQDVYSSIINQLDLARVKNYGSLSKNEDSLIYNWKSKDRQLIRFVFQSKNFCNLLAFLSGYSCEHTKKMLMLNTFFQDITINPSEYDPQTVLHSDTYYPAFKFWYFPDSVESNESPFSYCRKSHLLTSERLKFNYISALDILSNKNKAISKDHVEGSFRVTDREVLNLGSCREKIVVNPNTLVIANVMGFHARSKGEKVIKRRAIHGSLRHSNPFKI